jgi:ABC-type bacteriocin/lantibiotic exporter with double-glycine peptidase domain
MGRRQVIPIKQPSDNTCGPAAVKHALAVIGKRVSIKFLTGLCKTNNNGTSTDKIIKAFTNLKFSVLKVENANLRHLQRALKYSPNHIRAVMVSYLSIRNADGKFSEDSGHWATVASFSASKNRISVFDSACGKIKSYNWSDFRERWKDFDMIHRKNGHPGSYKLVHKWQRQLMLIIAKDKRHLPKFSLSSQELFPARVN